MSPMLLQPGQRVQGERGGSYQVVEWIGEGSYARVYCAEGASGPVALKLAKAEVDGAEDRLLREQEAHACVAHPAIPPLLDAGRVPPSIGCAAGACWLARRWVEGVTLRQSLERDRNLPLVRAVPLLLRIADAVAAVHAAGWSHGDLRPDNVLLEKSTNRAFLLDLGAARNEKKSSRASSDSPHPTHDIRQLGELLAWSLTGVDPVHELDCLSLARGYHPAAVHLWQDTRASHLSTAAAFRDRLQRLARQLGVPAEGKGKR